MNACATQPTGVGFIGSLTRFIDCQAETFGAGAFQALSLPGSTLYVVLSGFLTIFIALIGYNLLLGNGPTVRSGTLAFVKIGVVLALATSWPAYQILVYNLVTEAPGELVSELGSRSRLPGTDGTLVNRLDQADGAMVQLAILGAGIPASQQPSVPPPPFNGFDSFALGGSRIIFLVTAIAGLAAVRMIAALMLAIGPLFVAFLLFDSTRSFFEGWVRVLSGAALGAIGVTIALAFELAVLEPWLSNVLTRRMGGEAIPSAPTELFAISLLFAILVAVMFLACARVTRAFRFAMPLQQRGSGQLAAAGGVLGASSHFGSPSRPFDTRSRAAAVADVALAMQRRELATGVGRGQSLLASRWSTSSSVQTSSGDGLSRTPRSFGGSRRRVRSRITASASRRDRS